MIPTTSAQESLWLDGVPGTEYPSLQGSVEVDVAIIGGGVAGLSAARMLQRDGARVAVLEALQIGSGVTGCTTAKVSALQGTMYTTIRQRKGSDAARAYAEASLAGVEQLVELAEQNGIECDIERRPALTYAGSSSDLSSVQTEADAAAEAGLDVDYLTETDLPYEVAAAVRLDEQVQFHPVRFTRGLAAAVAGQGDGSAVYEGTRATSVEHGDPCVVKTGPGGVRAQQVIVATHYPLLDRGLYFARLEPQRSYCVAVRLASGAPSQSMAISAGSPTRSIRSYGDLLIVGGEGHPTGSGKATGERFEQLESFARQHWDVAEVTHRWSAHDLMPYDHLPMIGPYHPRTRRLWVTAGFMKWGFASATFAARILADAIAGRDNPWSEVFTPNRVSPRSGHEFAQLGLKFSADLVGDRLRPPQALRTSSIEPGQARVLPDGVGKKGVYRDDEGRLHAVSLRCTHLGCLLRFNAAERSWDCPCHGSRFDVDGTVLEGPAVNPLAQREP